MRNPSPFRKRLRGYDCRQVMQYIKKQKEEADYALENKQERLLSLRNENLELKRKLEMYQSREQEISLALVDAQAQARRIIQEAYARGEEEINQKKGQIRQLEAVAHNRRQTLDELTRKVSEVAHGFGMQVEEIRHELGSVEQPLLMRMETADESSIRRVEAANKQHDEGERLLIRIG